MIVGDVHKLLDHCLIPSFIPKFSHSNFEPDMSKGKPLKCQKVALCTEEGGETDYYM